MAYSSIKQIKLYAGSVLLAGVFALVSVAGIHAQSYDGETVAPDTDGNYDVAASTGDTVTLTDVGSSGGTLDVTFANGASGTIQITQHSSVPSGAPTAPPGVANIYFDVQLTGLTNADVSSAVWAFSVTEQWLADNGVTAENVFLYHYNGSEWEQRPTTVVSQSGGVVNLTADVSGFSPFAVTAVAGLSNTGSPAVLGFVVGTGLVAVAVAVALMTRRQKATQEAS